MVTGKTWLAPGPGLWEQDEAHQSAPITGYMAEICKSFFNPGIEEAGRRYGLLIERFDVAFLDGWMFMRPRIAAAPEKPGPLPPKWLFRLLFGLHPELRRRTKAARTAVESLTWQRDAEWWLNEGREPMRRRLRSAQATDLAALDDSGLRSHLKDVQRLIADGFHVHFRNALAHWIGVGDWLVKASEWTDEPPQRALLALKGASPASLDTLAYIQRIARATRESPAAVAAVTGQGDAAARLQALREASPAAAAALDEYFDEHGWRVFSGFDVSAITTIESPGSVLATIAAELDTRVNPPNAGEGYAQELRDRVPAHHLAAYDRLFETAKVVYGVRDDDVGPCFQWPVGLMRRALLEAGTRLMARGLLARVEHLFEATPEEVDALLGGGGARVDGDVMAQRAEAREQSARERPPSRLGEDEGPPPPDDWLPPAVARVNSALMLAMAVENGIVDQHATRVESDETLVGLAASGGSYEGRACIVQGPEGFARLQQGDVLIAPFTTPAYNVVLPLLGAVVTEKGGVLSHAAIVAREYSIPAVVNARDATSLIPDGAQVRVDGNSGTVLVLTGGEASKEVARALPAQTN